MNAPERKVVPEITTPIAENIPTEMKAERRWINWKYAQEKTRLGKPPCTATGYPMSALAPNNWTTFETALKAAQKSRGRLGLGFVLGDGWSGVDLDDIMVDGMMSDWAEDIVWADAGQIESYAEWSPSDEGVKVFCKGDFATVAQKSPDLSCGIETYTGSRYFAVTGRALKGSPAEVLEAPETVAAALSQAASWGNQAKKNPTPVRTDDDDLLLDDGMPTGGVGSLVKDRPGSTPQAGDLADPGSSISPARTSAAEGGRDVLANASVSGDWAQGGGEGPMHYLNRLALSARDIWVPACFPEAKLRGGGAWEIPSATFGSPSSDNLQISAKGVRDFGHKGDDDGGARTPIDLMMSPYCDAQTPHEAALRLMDMIGIPSRMLASLGTIYRHAAIEAGGPQDIFAEREWKGPAATWPGGILPKELDAYCVAVAKRKGVNENLSRALGLLVLGMMAPGRMRFQPRSAPDWEVPCTFFVTSVGYSSSGKSPLLREYFAPLNTVQKRWKAEYDAATKRYLRSKDAEKNRPKDQRGGAPKEPSRRQRKFTDTTVEAAIRHATEQCDSVINLMDELSGWFGGFERYKGGGNGLGGSDRANWVIGYEGDDADIGRVDKSRAASGVWTCSTVGNIQPAVLGKSYKALATDGLLQRFITMPFGETDLSDEGAEYDAEGAERYARTVEVLLDCANDFLTPVFVADAGARTVSFRCEAWAKAEAKRWPRTDPRHGILGKAHGVVARLTMALHLATWAWGVACGRNAPLATEVSGETAQQAFDLYREFFWPCIVQTYAEIEHAEETEDARTLALALLRLDEDRRSEMVPWQAKRLNAELGKDATGRIWRALRHLEESGWLKRVGIDKDQRWTINTQIYDGRFDERK